MKVASELQSKLDSILMSRSPEAHKQTGDESSPGYKLYHFAVQTEDMITQQGNVTTMLVVPAQAPSNLRLSPPAGILKTSTMELEPVPYATGDSIGSTFVFDHQQKSLQPLQEGSYFIYIDLNLTCTYKCGTGLLTVKVGDKLTCEVTLQNTTDSNPVSKKCWTVSQVSKEKLFAQMIVTEGVQNWKLELNSSRLGMFLVD
ncbi:hypothetical protein GBF38_022552 [Nibea albiflora]|uniref:Uncharacterized protein n=1 Tax=Nibea albiflora TaxID=240163 RepID=A0ACB7FL77_NIBAL|nr:hypothetical protein GBF38_022552 [Nibea albiflora]